MANVAADAQTTNLELATLIEEMKERRTELERVIKKEEEEKLRLQREFNLLKERLSGVENSLAKKYATRSEFDRTIAQTSSEFEKILSSSRMLLSNLKEESSLLMSSRK
mmetsp:Transcript_25626/g.29770  ORF Transcript_25626/g.29770 Transcript_25626/m.29770 type:complete len:109 (+) Transcript_25626:59-385(+)